MQIALALLVATTGCIAQDATEPAPVAPTPAPTARASYPLRSDIDLTVEALLPQPAADMVATLRDFHDAPAQTLFDVAEDAGVPAVGTLRDALPSYLEDKLYGWIDAEVAKLSVDGVKVTDLAGNAAALAETALTQFALDSELSVDGHGHATHTLTGIDLAPAGIDARIDLAFEATTTCDTLGSSLVLGDHTYGLPYGEYVWSMLGDVRGMLGAAVSCPSLAATIANKCVLGVCVGHARELTAICEAGLDATVEQAHTRIAALRLDALHFAQGRATLVDADRDGIAEALTGGVWTAEINAGQGLRPVPATFATR